jgi:hypothetical protein
LSWWCCSWRRNPFSIPSVALSPAAVARTDKNHSARVQVTGTSVAQHPAWMDGEERVTAPDGARQQWESCSSRRRGGAMAAARLTALLFFFHGKKKGAEIRGVWSNTWTCLMYVCTVWCLSYVPEQPNVPLLLRSKRQTISFRGL